MALEVVFRPQAEDESLELRQWYDSKRLGLGREFREELNAVADATVVVLAIRGRRHLSRWQRRA